MTHDTTLESKMNKHSTEVLIILLYPMIQLLDLRTLEKTDNAFLKLAAALSRNYLYELNSFCLRFSYNALKLMFNSQAITEYFMQIEFDSSHRLKLTSKTLITG
jgi:hypothetical protein